MESITEEIIVASFGWILLTWFVIGNIIFNGKYFIRLFKITQYKRGKARKARTRSIATMQSSERKSVRTDYQ